MNWGGIFGTKLSLKQMALENDPGDLGKVRKSRMIHFDEEKESKC